MILYYVSIEDFCIVYVILFDIMAKLEEEEVLFDEFGNPLNDSGDEYSDSNSEEENNPQIDDINSSDDEQQDNVTSREIVLPEEKSHFQSLESTFGPNVDITIAHGDAKTIDEPMIDPEVEQIFRLEEDKIPTTTYSKDYLWKLTELPNKVMNVAICGNVHSGKTSLIDMLIMQTHPDLKCERYLDNHIIEQQRGISIKSNVMTLLLPDLKGVSNVVNLIDTPGHINFTDELSISIGLADSIVLCVDVVEGITKSTELVIEQALKTNTKFVLMITKFDRLMMELKLPVLDSYYKIRNVIDSVNSTIKSIGMEYNITLDDWKVSPELNNVCFSSQLFNFIFNLNSFSMLYLERYNMENVSVDDFGKKLWGDIYFINGKFKRKVQNKSEFSNKRTFITFILEPIYKIAIRAITIDAPELKRFLQKHLNLKLPVSHLKVNQKPLLSLIFSHFFGIPSPSLINSLKETTFSTLENNLNKFNYYFTESKIELKESIAICDPTGPLVAFISRLMDTSDSSHFYAQVRVLSGTLTAGSNIKIIGEDFENDDSNIKIQKINKCYLQCGRYKYDVPNLKAGSIGLISGPDLDTFIIKTGTIYDENSVTEGNTASFRSNQQIVDPVFKMGIQPKNPKEADKFNSGIKKLIRSYHGCKIEVDETGKYFIYGFGEIYLDCALHDLRKLYGQLEINVSDPMVQFNETVDSQTKIRIITKSNNGLNSITITAEPLNRITSNDLLSGKLDPTRISPRELSRILKKKYNWDSLSARTIWHIGPTKRSSSILIDDTLPYKVDKKTMQELKSSIIQGFQWAVNEGPLSGENVRNVIFRIIDIEFATDEIDRNSTQITQMVRKSVHASIIASLPKMMEPTFFVEVISFSDVMDILEKLVKRRRGKINDKIEIAGTPLFKVFIKLPVIDSFGFETDLRLVTRGHAFPQMISSIWINVPGDPLNETAFLPMLKPASYESLGRDFMIKTRRRKDLSDNVSLEQFVDAETWNKLQFYFQ